MATKTDYQNLLDDVLDILDKNDKKRKDRLKNGDSFNIFTTIGKSSDEVNIHSKFLAMLLDPKGEHGCGDAFLRIFCKKTVKNIGNLDLDKAEVFAEYSIGPIRNGGTKGGRVDILIKFGKEYAIIIENKIYAGDQENQLLRYRNYAKETKYKNYKILYLTLDGHSPEEKSTGVNIEKASQDEIYWSEISYSNEIKDFLQNWINSKRNENKTWIYPVVEQYIKLIDEITDQNSDDESEKIIKLLFENDNLALAEEMKEGIRFTKKQIFNDFCENELKVLAKNDYKLTTKEDEDEEHLFRRHLAKSKWKYYRLTFELDFNSYDCKFGVTIRDDNDIDGRKRPRIEKELRKLQDYKNEHFWWMIWDYLEGDYANWNAESFVKVKYEPKELLGIIDEKLRQYSPVLDELAKNL